MRLYNLNMLKQMKSKLSHELYVSSPLVLHSMLERRLGIPASLCVIA